jgi:hypothetical protein
MEDRRVETREAHETIERDSRSYSQGIFHRKGTLCKKIVLVPFRLVAELDNVVGQVNV